MGVLSRTPATIDCDRPAAADLLRVVAAWAVASFHIWQQSWFSLGSDHWQRAGSMLLFTLLHWPCSTTLLTIRKETGSRKWTALAAALPTALGILLCCVFTALCGKVV